MYLQWLSKRRPKGFNSRVDYKTCQLPGNTLCTHFDRLLSSVEFKAFPQQDSNSHSFCLINGLCSKLDFKKAEGSDQNNTSSEATRLGCTTRANPSEVVLCN